jgi:hypothetical protein
LDTCCIPISIPLVRKGMAAFGLGVSFGEYLILLVGGSYPGMAGRSLVAALRSALDVSVTFLGLGVLKVCKKNWF